MWGSEEPGDDLPVGFRSGAGGFGAPQRADPLRSACVPERLPDLPAGGGVHIPALLLHA